jgi:DNA-directed RNA polymerase subunit RPC12/RpoP
MPKKPLTEFNEKKDFFVVCDKCNSKIFQHKGFLESPKGAFCFAVECPYCGSGFLWQNR